MRDELAQACLDADARNGWRREQCDVMKEWWQDWERREACPEVWGVPVGRRATGGRCVSTPRSRERFVHPVSWPCSAGELARRYLRTCMKAQRYRYKLGSPMRGKAGGQRLPFRKGSLGLFTLERNASFYAGGTLTGEWAVVDIDSAYFAIASAAPMDIWLRLSPVRVSVGLGRCEFLRADELTDRSVQRAVVGMFCRTTMECERFGKPYTYPWSSFCSPGITGLVHLTMSAIAYDAVRNFGAVHFATDAAVVPLGRRDAWAAHLAGAWGLSSHIIAEGRGTLYGHNTWEIGEQSRNARRFKTASGSPLSNLVGQGSMRPELVASVRQLRGELLSRAAERPEWPG